ncbi:glycerophosphodiester phosphodiesterase [Altererythrobacter sp. SALINAS58]|uniref:glycerophosphodiester phosphodiesterase family protein n=1 Tax=Alteripontixanthobacter muriae TaxID=2705546 RepID=UPI001575D182|nr:glycerophosphodiester phosphodiesterase family protein [Alteripontixanthobacter muriae]NTZ43685.1 glycerophosphodiester phosphodiesterase [Alteripontixanthobacter muriae]
MRSLPSGRTDRDPNRTGWLTGHVYAHRGLHGTMAGGRVLVENSLSAFEAAAERGLGVECDVQRSADDQAVVFHDWELDRLTGECGPVAKRSASELASIPLTGGNDAIAPLGEVLRQIAGRVPVLVEIKSRANLPHGPICHSVSRAIVSSPSSNIAVMSFDPRVGAWFARFAPGIPRGLVVTEEGERGWQGRLKRSLAMRHARPDFLAVDIRDLPSAFAARHRAAGMPILSWTVRSPELRERAALHADAPIAEGTGLLPSEGLMAGAQS